MLLEEVTKKFFLFWETPRIEAYAYDIRVLF